MSGCYPSRNTRVAHCPPNPGLPNRYEISFLFDETTGRTAYWIHQEKKRFFVVGVEPEPDEVSVLAEALGSQLDVGEDGEPPTLLKDGTEEKTFSFQGAAGEIISWTQRKQDRLEEQASDMLPLVRMWNREPSRVAEQ
jgi:hypothetical protein